MFQITILNFSTLGDFEENLDFCQTSYFELWYTFRLTLNIFLSETININQMMAQRSSL